jgi:uncharacterized ferredoxin-like protein
MTMGRSRTGHSGARTAPSNNGIVSHGPTDAEVLEKLREDMEKLREDRDSVIQLRQVEIDHLKYQHTLANQVRGFDFS